MRRNLTMDRKTYMRDIYSKYWINAREEIYGFTQYDKNLCSYICENVPKGENILEVAIGTGFPFGDFFQEAGYQVHGVDISPILIEKCRELNAKINCKVGDSEDLDYQDEYFYCTYCFHSTWYFPNLCKAIDEIVRVTIPGGMIIFDIQNRNNKEIDTAYRKNLTRGKGMRRLLGYGKSIAKIALRRGIPVWHNVTHEVPTYPETIYQHFETTQNVNFQVMLKNEDESLESRNAISSFRDFARLVFVVKK
jgi:ubiquinone/menaquinone biosynthesis C-methylase UbiE